MCGFITVINSKEKKKFDFLFKRLKKINNHRGPDNIKYTKDKNFIIFRRLSIIDTSRNSDQPFENINKNVVMVYNGEIYNYLELKKKLKKLGHIFLTSSDTEVIMKCYEEWGIHFLKKIRGMFSIIIFDKSLCKIFFIRDHFGQKPLYYCKLGKNLL